MSSVSERFIDSVLNDTAKYLYAAAENVVGTEGFDVYMDAADALMDVLGYWVDTEAWVDGLSYSKDGDTA
jgi:hypothetical protein